MSTYNIEVRNRETKEWETQEIGEAKSRRNFLHGSKPDELSRHKKMVKSKSQWRCHELH